MIFKVQKRRFRKDGKLQTTRCYYLRYRTGDMPIDRWVSLGVTDSQVANKKAQEFIQEKEREAAGIIEPKVVRDAALRPLVEHLDDYEADLLTRGQAGRGGRGARLLKARIIRLTGECRWKLACHVTAESFVAWRNQHKAAARTQNHYLQGMVSFLNWLERVGRIRTNPLKFVGKVDERGQKKRVRRAFTDTELSKLIEGSGSRGTIYFTAARTGLRQEELRQLVWGDVRLDGKIPQIIVRAETAKNKTQEPVCLVPEIVEALTAHRPAHWAQNDLVFPQGVPRASRLKVDAERVGVAYRDEQGRYADFHALRYTWATFMRKNGIGDNFARKQMRHQTVRQTDGYTDEAQLPIYDSIKNLPRLGSYTQIRAQILAAEGQNVAQPVAVCEGMESEKTLVNGGVCLGLASLDVGNELERAKGFEPSTSTLARWCSTN
jgi:integrase